MAERMWTYPELKFVFVNHLKVNPQELAVMVNREFHGGIERIRRKKTIFGESRLY